MVKRLVMWGTPLGIPLELSDDVILFGVDSGSVGCFSSVECIQRPKARSFPDGVVSGWLPDWSNRRGGLPYCRDLLF